MIKVEKSLPLPAKLFTPNVEGRKQEIGSKIERGIRTTSTDFTPYYNDREIKNRLLSDQHSKCCYCERHREIRYESDVEHFRPKTNVSDDADHPGYWWLAYDWENLLISCSNCNRRHKRNQFPLFEGSFRARGPEDDLEAERPILINPTREDPEEFIGYVWDPEVAIVRLTDSPNETNRRGSMNAGILGLNRSALMVERGRHLVALSKAAVAYQLAVAQNNAHLIGDAKETIREYTKEEREFSGFAKFYFRSVGVGHLLSTDN